MAILQGFGDHLWESLRHGRFPVQAQSLALLTALSNELNATQAGNDTGLAIANSISDAVNADSGLAELDEGIASEASTACVDFQTTMRKFLLSNIWVDYGAYTQACNPGPFCDITRSKTAVSWLSEALSTIGGQWTALSFVAIVIWEVTCWCMWRRGIFENVTEHFCAPAAAAPPGTPAADAPFLDSTAARSDGTLTSILKLWLDMHAHGGRASMVTDMFFAGLASMLELQPASHGTPTTPESRVKPWRPANNNHSPGSC